MTSLMISRATEDHILLERYCEDEQMVHTVIISPSELWAMCKVAWPEAAHAWTHREPGVLALPLWFEKNPQEAPEGPEGVEYINTEAQAAGVFPVDLRAA
jgi:hypothetical protein